MTIPDELAEIWASIGGEAVMHPIPPAEDTEKEQTDAR